MKDPKAPDMITLESIEAAAWGDYFLAGGGTVIHLDGVTVLSAPRFPFPDANRAIGLGSLAIATPQLLDRTVDSFAPDVPFYLQVPPKSDPPELHDWILSRGFTPRRRWVKLYRDLRHLGADTDLAPREIRVALTRPEDANRFGETICACFGFPDAMAPWMAALTGRSGWRTYLAYVENSVAGAAALYMKGTVGSLVAGGVLREHRRKGVQGALIERRIRDAAEGGVELLVSEAAEDIPEKPNPSLHNLLRLGLREAYKRENYQRP